MSNFGAPSAENLRQRRDFQTPIAARSSRFIHLPAGEVDRGDLTARAAYAAMRFLMHEGAQARSQAGGMLSRTEAETFTTCGNVRRARAAAGGAG